MLAWSASLLPESAVAAPKTQPTVTDSIDLWGIEDAGQPLVWRKIEDCQVKRDGKPTGANACRAGSARWRLERKDGSRVLYELFPGGNPAGVSLINASLIRIQYDTHATLVHLPSGEETRTDLTLTHNYAYLGVQPSLFLSRPLSAPDSDGRVPLYPVYDDGRIGEALPDSDARRQMVFSSGSAQDYCRGQSLLAALPVERLRTERWREIRRTTIDGTDPVLRGYATDEERCDAYAQHVLFGLAHDGSGWWRIEPRDLSRSGTAAWPTYEAAVAALRIAGATPAQAESLAAVQGRREAAERAATLAAADLARRQAAEAVQAEADRLVEQGLYEEALKRVAPLDDIRVYARYLLKWRAAPLAQLEDALADARWRQFSYHPQERFDLQARANYLSGCAMLRSQPDPSVRTPVTHLRKSELQAQALKRHRFEPGERLVWDESLQDWVKVYDPFGRVPNVINQQSPEEKAQAAARWRAGREAAYAECMANIPASQD